MIDRILAYFGYYKRDWVKRNGVRDADALARANRWISFYNEAGGIKDMIEGIRRSYFEKVGGLKPGDEEALAALGMADRIARELDSSIQAVIDSGKLAKQAKEHADKIASLPEARRRRL